MLDRGQNRLRIKPILDHVFNPKGAIDAQDDQLQRWNELRLSFSEKSKMQDDFLLAFNQPVEGYESHGFACYSEDRLNALHIQLKENFQTVMLLSAVFRYKKIYGDDLEFLRVREAESQQVGDSWGPKVVLKITIDGIEQVVQMYGPPFPRERKQREEFKKWLLIAARLRKQATGVDQYQWSNNTAFCTDELWTPFIFYNADLNNSFQTSSKEQAKNIERLGSFFFENSPIVSSIVANTKVSKIMKFYPRLSGDSVAERFAKELLGDGDSEAPLLLTTVTYPDTNKKFCVTHGDEWGANFVDVEGKIMAIDFEDSLVLVADQNGDFLNGSVHSCGGRLSYRMLTTERPRKEENFTLPNQPEAFNSMNSLGRLFTALVQVWSTLERAKEEGRPTDSEATSLFNTMLSEIDRRLKPDQAVSRGNRLEVAFKRRRMLKAQLLFACWDWALLWKERGKFPESAFGSFTEAIVQSLSNLQFQQPSGGHTDGLPLPEQHPKVTRPMRVKELSIDLSTENPRYVEALQSPLLHNDDMKIHEKLRHHQEVRESNVDIVTVLDQHGNILYTKGGNQPSPSISTALKKSIANPSRLQEAKPMVVVRLEKGPLTEKLPNDFTERLGQMIDHLISIRGGGDAHNDYHKTKVEFVDYSVEGEFEQLWNPLFFKPPMFILFDLASSESHQSSAAQRCSARDHIRSTSDSFLFLHSTFSKESDVESGTIIATHKEIPTGIGVVWNIDDLQTRNHCENILSVFFNQVARTLFRRVHEIDFTTKMHDAMVEGAVSSMFDRRSGVAKSVAVYSEAGTDLKPAVRFDLETAPWVLPILQCIDEVLTASNFVEQEGRLVRFAKRNLEMQRAFDEAGGFDPTCAPEAFKNVNETIKNDYKIALEDNHHARLFASKEWKNLCNISSKINHVAYSHEILENFERFVQFVELRGCMLSISKLDLEREEINIFCEEVKIDPKIGAWYL